jgi:hypothetical protein
MQSERDVAGRDARPVHSARLPSEHPKGGVLQAVVRRLGTSQPREALSTLAV